MTPHKQHTVLEARCVPAVEWPGGRRGGDAQDVPRRRRDVVRQAVSGQPVAEPLQPPLPGRRGPLGVAEQGDRESKI